MTTVSLSSEKFQSAPTKNLDAWCWNRTQGGKEIPICETINFQGGFSFATGDFNPDNAPDLAIPIEQYGKVAILLNEK